MSSDKSIFDALKSVATATITTVLLKKGLRNVWLRGTKPLQPNLPRIVGRASLFDLYRLAKTSPRQNRGPRRSRPAGPSKQCPKAVLPS